MCPVPRIQPSIEARRVAVGSGGPFPPAPAEFPCVQLSQSVYPSLLDTHLACFPFSGNYEQSCHEPGDKSFGEQKFFIYLG